MASESTVSNTELGEFLGPHRAPGSELSEFLSAYHLCAKATHRVFRRLTEFAAEPSEPHLPKQSSRSSIPPVSYLIEGQKIYMDSSKLFPHRPF